MKINREKLLDCLNTVAPGLATKDAIEYSTSFIFKDGKVYTFNDKLLVSYPIDIGIEGAVKATELLKLLAKIKTEEIDISKKDNQFLVKTKKIKATIKLSIDPKLPFGEVEPKKNKWKNLPEDFNTALSFNLFSTAKLRATPILTYLHVCGDIVESTDNYRITTYKMSDSIADTLLISYDSVIELLKYVVTKYQKNDNWIFFKDASGLVFSCRTIADEYPNISQFIDVEGPKIKLPKNIIDLIERSQIFSNTDIENEKVRITIEDGLFTISAKGDHGQIEEHAKIKYSGETSTILINPKFLKQIAERQTRMIIGESKLKFKTSKMQHVIMLISED
jgi:hypothetical protein